MPIGSLCPRHRDCMQAESTIGQPGLGCAARNDKEKVGSPSLTEAPVHRRVCHLAEDASLKERPTFGIGVPPQRLFGLPTLYNQS